MKEWEAGIQIEVRRRWDLAQRWKPADGFLYHQNELSKNEVRTAAATIIGLIEENIPTIPEEAITEYAGDVVERRQFYSLRATLKNQTNERVDIWVVKHAAQFGSLAEVRISSETLEQYMYARTGTGQGTEVVTTGIVFIRDLIADALHREPDLIGYQPYEEPRVKAVQQEPYSKLSQYYRIYAHRWHDIERSGDISLLPSEQDPGRNSIASVALAQQIAARAFGLKLPA